MEILLATHAAAAKTESRPHALAQSEQTPGNLFGALLAAAMAHTPGKATVSATDDPAWIRQLLQSGGGWLKQLAADEEQQIALALEIRAMILSLFNESEGISDRPFVEQPAGMKDDVPATLQQAWLELQPLLQALWQAAMGEAVHSPAWMQEGRTGQIMPSHVGPETADSKGHDRFAAVTEQKAREMIAQIAGLIRSFKPFGNLQDSTVRQAEALNRVPFSPGAIQQDAMTRNGPVFGQPAKPVMANLRPGAGEWMVHSSQQSLNGPDFRTGFARFAKADGLEGRPLPFSLINDFAEQAVEVRQLARISHGLSSALRHSHPATENMPSVPGTANIFAHPVAEDMAQTPVTFGQPALEAADRNIWARTVNIRQFAEQMGDMMVKQFRVWQGDGLAEAKLTLIPETLGKIQVQLSLQNGQLTAKFIAETLAGREAIEGQLNQLRASLQQQGIQVEKIEVAEPWTSSSGMLSEQRQQAFAWQFGQQAGNGPKTRPSRDIAEEAYISPYEHDRTDEIHGLYHRYGGTFEVTA